MVKRGHFGVVYPANAPYSQQVKDSFGELLRIVRIECARKDAVYSEIKSAIVAYENQVMQDEKLTEAEEQKLLEASSIARHSVYYWMEVDPRGIELRGGRILRWIAAITSDIAGGLVSGNIGYASECSEYAFDLVTYSLP